ncbi:cytochrome b5-like heme/steroid binding domain-containing protein [Cyathus striatus]|nr:cytochrome b5-like heme/steroid binding domain-containing protein [Cyathus striatus]
MSWLKEMAGGPALPPYKEPAGPSSEPKVSDPAIPNRMVSNKSANRPFLAYKEYREQQEALHAAWVQKKKERDEKIARGEKVGSLEPDPTAQHEVGLLGLMKFIVYCIIFLALAGKFITGSYTWEYQSKWTQLKTYWPTNQRLFSERLLAEYDGSVEGRPIYLAIDGDVYDVSKGRSYQPGGSYHILAGVDAARAFGTGCFKEHRTHDTRGMSDDELRGLQHWKNFYAEHKDYIKVGRVVHTPIDPNSPILEHCDPKKAAKQKSQRHLTATSTQKPSATEKSTKETEHKEL